MTNTTLAILYRSPGGNRALPVAELADSDLVLEVARRAISEKRLEADALIHCDGDLAMLAGIDADRLERVLQLLIPALRPGRAGRSVPPLAM